MRESTGNLLKSGQYWNDNLRLIQITIREQAFYRREEPYDQLGWKKLVECRKDGEYIFQTSYEYFERMVELGIYTVVTELPSGCNWIED